MTVTTKDSTKPKKRPLWRKLGVVVGLVVFAVVAMVSSGLSNPRPSLREIHDWIDAHTERGGDPLRSGEVVAMLGEPDDSNDAQGTRAWVMYNWKESKSEGLDLWVNADGSIDRSDYMHAQIGPLRFFYDYWINFRLGAFLMRFGF